MEEQHIWTSDSNSNSSSTTIGRVMNSLLTSRPRKLEDAISRLGSSSQRSAAGSLEEPLCVLQKYVRDSVDNEEMLDQILVPMIENSLKWKDSKHGNQVMILLNWLFQDELLFKALSKNIVNIIMRKDDRYIKLGWCTMIRGLVDHGINTGQSANIGIQVKYHTLLKDLCSSITHLSSVICNGSTFQDGYELPTRLSVAAADCVLVLTEALTRKASSSGVSTARKMSPDSDKETLLVTSAPNASGGKKVKSISGFSQGTENMEMEMGVLLWDHLDELIIVVLKLLAWSRKSRPLHAKSSEQVLKWLQEIKEHYSSIQDEGEIFSEQEY